MKINNEATTTAELADLPTPSVPFWEHPKQPTNPISDKGEGITSVYSSDSKTWWK